MAHGWLLRAVLLPEPSVSETTVSPLLLPSREGSERQQGQLASSGGPGGTLGTHSSQDAI